ncbi:Na+/H+ antiporter subunit E [Thioalbus denitrificans]|uniref:Multicomponent Na+:H+ antiporter subunit E n=1 Tax=Thioalbus denitrificans TaxID=547122 RepID=A0A369CGE0_9GAMM|nr:Na+/H+ antiporter subunit E [Thioalbus denitrificans]RCX32763.1 multicomponent Na+:H+ antiporter subunit E [Thioalbus denitrificans]
MTPPAPLSRGFRPATALLAAAVLWWILAGGSAASWAIGVPAVVLAAWSARRLGTGSALSLTGLLRFLPFFAWESLRGGVDVARRTLGPRLRIAPGFLDYRTALPEGAPRRFFATCVSLLPGTLAAEIEGDTLAVHQLDAGGDSQAELARLERAVAGLFGLPGARPHG